MHRRILGLVFALASCGPRAKETPAPAAPVAVAKPPSSFRRVAILRRYYRPEARCTNGPFELPFTLPDARWGAELTVRMIGPRSLHGHVEVSSIAGSENAWYYSDLRSPDARCVAAGPAAAAPPVEAAPGKPVKAGKAPPAAKAPSPPAAAKPVRLAALVERPALAKGAEEHVMGGTFFAVRPELEHEAPDLEGGCWRSTGRYPAIEMAARVWFETVQDLDGAALEVVAEEIVPTGSDEAFARAIAERRAHDRAVVAELAAACAAHPGEHSCYSGCERAGEAQVVLHAATAPPAPRVEVRPPRPAGGAEWIAGSWRWGDAGWAWDAGFWQRPQDLVALALPTPAAAPPPVPPPAAPPPPAPHIEAAPPPPPQVGVVWVAGYWVWAGPGWAWVPGAWRIAPSPRARWVPPAPWAPRGPHPVVRWPGGWIVR